MKCKLSDFPGLIKAGAPFFFPSANRAVRNTKLPSDLRAGYKFFVIGHVCAYQVRIGHNMACSN
jgi:hypothetical protein